MQHISISIHVTYMKCKVPCFLDMPIIFVTRAYDYMRI